MVYSHYISMCRDALSYYFHTTLSCWALGPVLRLIIMAQTVYLISVIILDGVYVAIFSLLMEEFFVSHSMAYQCHSAHMTKLEFPNHPQTCFCSQKWKKLPDGIPLLNHCLWIEVTDIIWFSYKLVEGDLQKESVCCFILTSNMTQDKGIQHT